MKLLLKIIFKDLYKIFTDSNYREFLKLVFLHGGKPRYIPDNISFLNYKIDIVDHLSFIWQFKEIFVDEIYKFKSETNSPLIYDCGANIGISSLYFKKIYPDSKIKSFEADPKIAEIFKANLKSYNDVEIINKAVWVNDDGIEMSFEGADSASIYLDDNKVRVNSLDLNELLSKEDTIDFLKMDIEGAEVDVIKKCKENLYKVENLFIEYHSFINHYQDLDTILQVLKENGFRYFIKQPADRNIPFINKVNKNYPAMDLQLNIFAYRN